ncbi:MAG TPA: diguanylate cyclase, partial [Ramlibacter sp.]|nr:diguanylate cyclase [Ramlibacter sp.]
AAIRRQLGSSKAARLVEANEHLVLAALAAQRAADAGAQALAAMAEAAQLDPLTRLSTSAVMRTRLASAVAAARQDGGRVALLLLSLADFKLINDTLGNAIGDQVLELAAGSLVASAGPSATVCRHRGKEFLVLLPRLADVTEAVAQAAAVVQALGAPRLLHEHVLRLSANVGISIYPEDGADPDSLIDRAMAAMYSAKWRGLGSYAFVSEPATSERSLELRTLESLRPPPIALQSAAQASATQHVLLQEANTQLVLAAIGAQELQGAAEQAQRRQSTFLGVLAHELRNPLTPITNAASILGRIQSEGPLLAKVQGIIERQVKTMSRLVEDVLDLTRVNSGKLRFEKEWVDLGSLVSHVLDACRPAMDARLQRLEVELPLPGVVLHGDPVRLTQILTNLLRNASKYTPERGEIRLSMEVAGDAVRLTVADDGIGITPEALTTIFNPFTQEQHATLFNGDGLGIGLTIVREMVQGHGGTVTAASAGIGLGSQFIVTLPLQPVQHP